MINRNNYEEFLLMYVDNELTSHQRSAVELFVQQNPDLLSELKTLEQTKLSPDGDGIFMDNSLLLKINNGISIDNHEDYFLLDIDNELDAATKNDVEKFVLQHPELQQAYSLLKQTVLETEEVIFLDKQSLYREEKKRRVVPLNWMRMAAAAAIIGFAVMVWWLMPGGKDDDTVLSSVQTADEKVLSPKEGFNQDVQGVTVEPEQKYDDIAAVKEQEATDNGKAIKGQKINIASQASNVIVRNDSPEKLNENIFAEEVVPVSKEEVFVFAAPPVENNAGQAIETSFENTMQKDIDRNAFVQPAVYRELDTENDKDQSLYIGNMDFNKNKLRGVMKKVGGIFAGRSKSAYASNDQGKLQVANLELNTN